jgi:hypothetical protein
VKLKASPVPKSTKGFIVQVELGIGAKHGKKSCCSRFAYIVFPKCKFLATDPKHKYFGIAAFVCHWELEPFYHFQAKGVKLNHWLPVLSVHDTVGFLRQTSEGVPDSFDVVRYWVTKFGVFSYTKLLELLIDLRRDLILNWEVLAANGVYLRLNGLVDHCVDYIADELFPFHTAVTVHVNVLEKLNRAVYDVRLLVFGARHVLQQCVDEVSQGAPSICSLKKCL